MEHEEEESCGELIGVVSGEVRGDVRGDSGRSQGSCRHCAAVTRAWGSMHSIRVSMALASCETASQPHSLGNEGCHSGLNAGGRSKGGDPTSMV